MFNAVNLNLIAFSFRLGDLAGQVLAIFVITIAAAEAAIGLGLIIALVRLKDTIALDEADVMRS
jgi:NADH-quinone oxidoreductase subunit K